MIRIAAVGDIHIGTDSAGVLRQQLERLPDQADLFLLAGDLTRVGDPAEAAILADELASLRIPVVAVLGNHDYHGDAVAEIEAVLVRAGLTVLEGDAVTLDLGGTRVGIAATKGFGGGFAGATGSEFGEPEMKAFIRRTKAHAERLEQSLSGLEADIRIALLHYAPIRDTLQGEPLELYPFLGSYLLGEAIDRAGADLVFHGHAHKGCEHGVTPGGIQVRNVAQPVLGHAYGLYCLNGDSEDVAVAAAASPTAMPSGRATP